MMAINTVQRSTVHCSTVTCRVVQCRAMQYSAVQCVHCTVQYSATPLSMPMSLTPVPIKIGLDGPRYQADTRLKIPGLHCLTLNYIVNNSSSILH